jgi:hypothetical protein
MSRLIYNAVVEGQEEVKEERWYTEALKRDFRMIFIVEHLTSKFRKTKVFIIMFT